jgi:hypothetical protein
MKSINQSDVPTDFNSVNNSAQNLTEFKVKKTINYNPPSAILQIFKSRWRKNPQRAPEFSMAHLVSALIFKLKADLHYTTFAKNDRMRRTYTT